MSSAVKLPKLRLIGHRIWELDYIRGILLILVTIDHCCIFLPNFIIPNNAIGTLIIRIANDYTSLVLRSYFQPLVIFLFAFLSGINCKFAKNHLGRAVSIGLFTSAFMLLHKIGTLFLYPFLNGLLIFNILAVLTICMFVWVPIKRYRIPKAAIIGVACVLIAIGLYFLASLLMTGSYYQLPQNLKVFALLIYSQQGVNWSPNNFEPLLPALGFFLLGGVTGGVIYKNNRSLIKHLPNNFIKPVILMGKYSIYAYLFAPVVIIGLLYLLNGVKLI